MFGWRKDNEDPFGALQDGGTYHSEPTTVPSTATSTAWQPAGAATPNTPPTPSRPRPQRRRSSGPSLGWLGWFLVPLGLAVIVPLVLLVSSSGTTSSIGSAPIVTTPAQPSATTTAGGSHTTPKPAPVDYFSMPGLARGLAELAKLAPGAKILDLKVTAGALTGIMQRPNHSVAVVNVSPSTTFVAGAGATGEHPMAISAIHPRVVARLVAEMHSHFGIRPSRIDYLVAFWFPQAIPEWEVFVKGDSMHPYLATLAGAQLHRS